MDDNLRYEPVIGLEIHAQLLTDSKIFCRCSTKFGANENEQICPICLGLPGVLPVLNKRVVEHAIKLALATKCKIGSRSVFARKNYFYPDLPKGYQISQFEEPIAEFGHIEIEIDGQQKDIRLTRIHMEEDAGKSIHDESYVGKNETLVDVNRCGVPLVEIVTEPDIHSPEEAFIFLNKLRQLLLYLEICDGNMEEGSLRCDANISVRPKGSTAFGVRTEVKNMNSFHGVQKALKYEIGRQIRVLECGGQIVQETLLWNPSKSSAEPMRGKEYAHDYRYFPEPDLVPLDVNNTWINRIGDSLPEMPWEKRKRFCKQYKLPEYDANILTEQKELADYFETCAGAANDSKAVSNWIMSSVLHVLNEKKLSIKDFPVDPLQLAEMLNLVHNGTINYKIAKLVFAEMVETGKDVNTVINEKGLVQIEDKVEISKVIESVLRNNPKEVNLLLRGKEKLFGFLVGQVMKETKGMANPKMVNKILREELTKLRG